MNLRLAAQLAWSNTTHQWQRLLVRCLGIMFAVVLMFMQTGFRNALFDSNVRLIENLVDCDIIIRSTSRYMLSSGQTIALDRVTLAQGVAGVESAEPLYIENVVSELRPTGQPRRRIRVLAFDLRSPAFAPFQLVPLADRLEQPQTAVADVLSKPMFGFPDSPDAMTDEGRFGELAGKRIRLVGLFEMGIDFSNDGNLIIAPPNFARYFGYRGNGDPLSQVDYGIVRCRSDASITRVVSDLKRTLGPHVRVQTRDDFLRSERSFWGKSTPIGLIFRVGTLIGFVVGMIICYQVLATDISDHMGEFATLKAMGYGPPFFIAVVACQALLLSLVSFVPGAAVAAIAFQGINALTGLELFLNAPRLGIVLGLTVLMCILSGLIAVRKLLSADPASLF